MAGQRGAAAGEEVVEGEAGLDDERSAVGRLWWPAQQMRTAGTNPEAQLKMGMVVGRGLSKVGGVAEEAVALRRDFRDERNSAFSR